MTMTHSTHWYSLCLLLFLFLCLPLALFLHAHLAPATLGCGHFRGGLCLLQTCLLCLPLKLLLELLLRLLILDGVDYQRYWAIPDYLHVHVLPERPRLHLVWRVYRSQVLQKLIVQDLRSLVLHGIMEVGLRPLQLMVQGELRDQEDLIAVVHQARRPGLPTLVRPELQLQKLLRQVLIVQKVVCVGDPAEHHKASVYMRDHLRVRCHFPAQYSLHDYFHVIIITCFR